MSGESAIEWTDATWNPITGCTKISPGCTNCYAERLAHRLKAMGQPNYCNGFDVTLHPSVLSMPLRWKKPRRVFVNSMSDLFHEQVPEGFIHDVFETMRRATWHQFQVLTKRAARLKDYSESIDWPANVWAGVTVESMAYSERAAALRNANAPVRFVSMEPLLGPLDELDLSGIHWVIVGGESGPGARAMDEAWVLAVRDHCSASRVPFFFKQWGGTRRKAAGRMLDGRTWDEMPSVE